MNKNKKIQTIVVNDWIRLVTVPDKKHSIDWEAVILYILIILLSIPMLLIIYSIFILFTKPI